MKKLFYFLFIALFIQSCSVNEVESSYLGAKISAPETAYTGSYIKLQYVVKNSSDVSFANWGQAEENPVKYDNLNGLNHLALTKPGDYTFTLYLKDKNGGQDQLTHKIKVLESINDSGLEPSLEAWVRFQLLQPEGEITDFNQIKEFSIDDKLNFGENVNLGYNGVGKLTGLKKVVLSNTRLKNLDDFENCSKIEYLNLSFSDVNDISAIKNFKNLEYLRMGYSAVNDLSSISECQNLKFFEISYLQNSDFNHLASCTNLEVIEINGEVDNIDFLKSLKNIKKVLISSYSYKMADLEWLKDLTYLEDITIIGEEINSFESFKYHPNLKKINCLTKNISDLSPFCTLPNLEWLNLEYNKIEDLSPLFGDTKFTKPVKINLAHNPLKNYNLQKMVDLSKKEIYIFHH